MYNIYTKILHGVAFGFPAGVTFCDLIGSFAKVDGHSMQPTLNPEPGKNDFIVLSKWDKYNISRGQIIVLISPKDPRVSLIKRVIGLEGDMVSTMGYKTSVVEVPKGHIWVEGDHTVSSMDSNFFGPVPLGLVLAKASWIIWPLDRIQSLSKSYKVKNNKY